MNENTSKILKVEVTELLSKIIEVEATSFTDAIQKTKEMYRNEEIVLTADDFTGDVDFIPYSDVE